MNNFSDILKNLLKINNISQYELAKILSNSQQSISRYVNGVTEPDIYNLIKIAKFFNVTTDYLLGITDDLGTISNNNLSETENYMIQQMRLMNSEKKQELVSYANYLANKDSHKITNSKNIIDVSDLSDVERAEVVGFINGFRKELFSHKYSANTQSNSQSYTNKNNLNNIG